MELKDFSHYRITAEQNNELAKVDSHPWKDIPSCKIKGNEELSYLHKRLADLQQRFFVDRRKKFLIVLQGMDTSGKNGTIRHVFRGVNPQGVHVSSFDKPTSHELAHDYLWRVHRCTPLQSLVVLQPLPG